MKVQTSEEVREFLRSLAPEARRAIFRELHRIEAGQGSLVALEPPLERFYKVRAGAFRVLCAIDKNIAFALFVERRAVVYEVASAMLLDEILRRQRHN